MEEMMNTAAEVVDAPEVVDVPETVEEPTGAAETQEVAETPVEKKPKGEKGEGGHGGTFSLTPDMLQMVGSFTILRMSGMVGMVGIELKEKDLLDLNRQLNKIKVPKK